MIAFEALIVLSFERRYMNTCMYKLVRLPYSVIIYKHETKKPNQSIVFLSFNKTASLKHIALEERKHVNGIARLDHENFVHRWYELHLPSCQRQQMIAILLI